MNATMRHACTLFTLGLLLSCGSSEGDTADASAQQDAGPTDSSSVDGAGSSGDSLDVAAPEISATDARSADTSAPDASAPDTSAPDTASFPAPTPDNCVKSVSAGDHVYDCDGLSFNTAVPAACLTSACALVFDVHGLTMSAQIQEKNTGMRALAGKYGAIVVQPNAKPAPPMSSWSAADDGKVVAFLNRLRKVFHTDDKRVHFSGFSQGGDMSWRMLCAHADLFASVAPAAFSTGCFVSGKKPAMAVSTLYMHGNKDVLQPVSGAKKMRQAVVDAWQLGAAQEVSKSGDHLWTRRKTAAGVVVEFIEHDYAAMSPLLGGHCFPGSKDQLPSAPGQLLGYGCAGSSAFVWGEAVMAFFAAHPKP